MKMGISPGSTSDDPKQKIVMGYPSMDRYHHQTQQMYHPQVQPTPLYPVPAHAYPPSSSSSLHYHHHPQGFDRPHTPSDKYPGGYPPQPPYNYYQQQPYKPLVLPESSSDSASFGRVMLLLMIVLVASMCMMSLVMWFLFGTYIPEFEVSSLRVSNFTATNMTLTGVWDVDFSVRNTNKDLAVHFDRVVSSVFYKDALLGISSLQPFEVMKMEKSDLNFTMDVEQTPNDHKLQGWVLPTLAQDRNNGVVVFSLRLAMNANFTVPNMVYRQESLRVSCENMQVNFTPEGEGTLLPGLGNVCLIRLMESLKD